MNASVPANFYGKHTTWPMYVDVSRSGPCLPDTTTVPQVGILRSLLFDPGIDLSHLHDLNQASNCVPVEEVFCNSVTIVKCGIFSVNMKLNFIFCALLLPSCVPILFFTLLFFFFASSLSSDEGLGI
jgi:hypothetical protein